MGDYGFMMTLDPDNDVVVFAANVRHYGMTLRIR